MRAIFTVLVVGLVAAFLIPGLGTASPGPDLQVTVEGNGRVTSSDQKIDCPDRCSAEYPNQGSVELTQHPGENEQFNGWSGACQGVSGCKVEMTADREVTASFTGTSPQPTATATSEPSSSPTPTSEPSASPTPTSEPTTTASPTPTATAQASPAPTATPDPPQSPAEVAADLIRRAHAVVVVASPKRAFSVRAGEQFTCRRECVVAALVRSTGAKRPTLARGSARIRSGGRPAVALRLTRTGRRRLADGRERATLRITVQQDGRFARRSRTVLLRFKG